MLVLTFPPRLAVAGAEWTLDAPVSTSISALTGKTYISAADRPRRMAALNVEGVYDFGGGRMEAFKRALDGGLNAVRLHSHPLSMGEELGIEVPYQTQPLGWTHGGVPVNWTEGGIPVNWYTGAYYEPEGLPTVTILGDGETNGFGRATVTNAPASRTLGEVGSFVTIFSTNWLTSETRMLMRKARSNSSGEIDLWLDEPMTMSGRILFGTRDSGIFLLEDVPRWMRPPWQSWQVTWNFREIFADEIEPDTFTEFNLWGDE